MNSNLCPDPKEKYYSHKEEMKIDDLFQFPWALQMHIFIPNLILCSIYKIKLAKAQINITDTDTEKLEPEQIITPDPSDDDIIEF